MGSMWVLVPTLVLVTLLLYLRWRPQSNTNSDSTQEPQKPSRPAPQIIIKLPKHCPVGKKLKPNIKLTLGNEAGLCYEWLESYRCVNPMALKQAKTLPSKDWKLIATSRYDLFGLDPHFREFVPTEEQEKKLLRFQVKYDSNLIAKAHACVLSGKCARIGIHALASLPPIPRKWSLLNKCNNRSNASKETFVQY